VRVTVVSNPAKPIDGATIFTSWTDATGEGHMKVNDYVRSAPQPQTVEIRHEGFKDATGFQVWVRKEKWNKARPFDLPHCLISNEVEVKK